MAYLNYWLESWRSFNIWQILFVILFGLEQYAVIRHGDWIASKLKSKKVTK